MRGKKRKVDEKEEQKKNTEAKGVKRREEEKHE